MSLTSFIKRPEVVAKIKILRPQLPRAIPLSLKVKPRSERYWLVGTAFDYFLRFELQRRAPHAVARGWVAEYAPDLIWYETEHGGGGHMLGWDPDDLEDSGLPPWETAKRARVIVDNAKAAVAAFVKTKRPTRGKFVELASYALRLAHLDSVVRALKLDPHFEAVQSEEVEDLVSMLAIVPFDALLHRKILLLNPVFQDVPLLGSIADADLISGGGLIDFKTTMRNKIQASHLDQLLGYLLLARRQREIDPTFPVINRLGLYYCRQGYLWTAPVSRWTAHPQFQEVETWFFCQAEQLARMLKEAVTINASSI